MTQAPPSARPERPAVDTVLERFEQLARDTPGSAAVLHNPGDPTGGAPGRDPGRDPDRDPGPSRDGAPHGLLSYGELDARANRLAHHLLDGALPPGGLVAIGLPASRPELLVCVLAALKAGGTYALVDAAAPRTGRRQLAALPPYVLLTDAAHQVALDVPERQAVVRLGAEAARIAGRPATAPARHPGARDAAVLFTGAADPRPVRVGHALLLAAYGAWAELARLTPADRHLFTCGPDVTAFAAGWTRALCSGGSIVLPGRSGDGPRDLLDTALEARATVLHTDPATAAGLLLSDAGTGPLIPAPRRAPESGLATLRLLTVTGDRLYLDEHSALQDRLRPGARVLNVYAPTETAGAGISFELPQLQGPLDDPERISLLGTPFPGFRADPRDGELHLTPPGGAAVPTGDLAVLRPDGLLEFGGRLRDRITLDDGTRLDPYTVESEIRTHPAFGAAVVTRVSSGSRSRLVAYVSPPPADPLWRGAGQDARPEAVRAHLAGKAAPAATPRHVVRLRALPRTRAGQEDRAALPRPPEQDPPGPAGARRGGKGATAPAGPMPRGCAAGCAALPLFVAAMVLTPVLWPGSTDLTGVPGPWAFLFFVLYVCESAAFAAGVLFLFAGRARMAGQGRGRALTTAAHLSVAYLLIAWWPQDNLYRLAARHDWPRQAALVYAFNVPLMLAGLIVACYLLRAPRSPFDFDD
ncbi:AMP-binding protein [Streptomyces sp. NPDC059982]|uniref:AMP-binding protein n=1 Tax=unclassified Streptomyces TaxID=2593676 RepID=UPI00369F3044